jgi:hypothetical protein
MKMHSVWVRESTGRSRSRRAAASFETLLTLPLLLLAAAALVGLADLLVAEQLVSEASARAARVAALGGDETEIRQAVVAVLGPTRGSRAQISISNLEETPSPPVPGQLLEVRVAITVGEATLTWLVPASPSELLVGRSVMLRE